jgi:hypothetical protein
MNTEMPTDEVTDTIAHIEMQRQDAAREAGLAAACSEALRKLHALLASEKALQPPGARPSPNVDAVTAEINRIKRLAQSPRAVPSNARHGRRQASPRDGQHNPARNKGRRTMGRGGGR